MFKMFVKTDMYLQTFYISFTIEPQQKGMKSV